MRIRIAVVLLLLAAGCVSPIGVNRVGIQAGYQAITANALTGPTLSDETRVVLHRHELLALYEQQPADALRRLHEIACQNESPALLFALAEASYGAARQFERATWVRHQGAMVAGRQVARQYDFAAAVYAYLYLFSPEASASLYDPRARIACHLYNCGLAKALQGEKKAQLELGPRVMSLPMGKIDVIATRPGFPWTPRQFHEFVAADEYEVRGLSSRTRQPGLGVPLIGSPDRQAFGADWPSYYAKTFKVPATAFLRLQGSLRDMAGEGLNANLELYCPYDVGTIKVNEQPVPLEVDLTAHLAYALEGAAVWKTEVSQFLSGQQFIKTSVYLTQPYEPGKIPVVFVHGTSGSPGRWTEMFNTLQADPVLRQRYQFWYFIYNSGQPVAYSAMLLREGLENVVRQLDPGGADPAVRQMVLIGHSQGGLLARLAIVHSGDRLWTKYYDKPLDELKLSPTTRSLLQRTLFFEPSPYVQRVVFMCTPHQGSYRVSNIVKKLTGWLVALPGDVFRAGRDLVTGNPEALPRKVRRGDATAVAGMKPGSPFLTALAEMPFADGVHRHSIVAVVPGMDIATGNDEVVAYQSAHLADVESEFVVRFRHSCQDQPAAINEVRRILQVNLAPNGAAPQP